MPSATNAISSPTTAIPLPRARERPTGSGSPSTSASPPWTKSAGASISSCPARPAARNDAPYPLRTPAGWLTLYHAVGADGHYRLGALLLDLDDPSQVIGRSRDWLMQPEEWYELEGYYPGVCFPCGKVLIGDTLYIYYGGADKYIGLATCKLQELLEDLTQP